MWNLQQNEKSEISSEFNKQYNELQNVNTKFLMQKRKFVEKIIEIKRNSALSFPRLIKFGMHAKGRAIIKMNYISMT